METIKEMKPMTDDLRRNYMKQDTINIDNDFINKSHAISNKIIQFIIKEFASYGTNEIIVALLSIIVEQIKNEKKEHPNRDMSILINTIKNCFDFETENIQ